MSMYVLAVSEPRRSMIAMRNDWSLACLLVLACVGCGGTPFSEAPQDAGGGGAAGNAPDASAGTGGDAGDASAGTSGDATVEADVSVDVSEGGDAPEDADPCSDAGTTGLGTIGETCCSAASLACAGHAQKVVLICDPKTMQWDALQACGGQTLCDTQPGMNQGTCQPVVPVCAGLQPGDSLCFGNVSVECGPDLVTSIETTCAFACEAGTCLGDCSPGDRRCDESTPQVCDSKGEWQSEAPCAFLCTAEGQCTGECVPGVKRCQGNVPEQCSADGQWESGDPCAAVCNDGVCEGACTPDATQCSGLIKQLCNATGQWDDVAECEYVCSSGACTGVCAPGSKQCSGLVPQTCNPQGQWQSGTACSYVCSGGTCIGECAPGAKDCVGLKPRTCGTNGGWTEGLSCTYVCVAGECSGECVPGAKRCDGLIPQTCSSAGLWVNGAPCANVCTAGTCTGSCTPGAKQCNGLIPQTCDANGQWVSDAPCPYVCAGGVCSGVCSPGTKDCVGQTPRTCSADGEWQTGSACVSQACIEGECTGVCEPQTKRCNGRAVQTCGTMGQWSSSLCSGTTPVCSDGQCVGGGAPGPSCQDLPNNCEQSANCCWSTVVPGGTFLRSNGPAYPATVSKFRMDLYEVTVGRFRKFVNAGKGTQLDPPAVGSGAHPKVPDSGWQAAWSLQLPPNSAALSAAITCMGNGFATWTENATTNSENRPINCVTWYEAFAFCVWDGGRLATEAEWNYAAAGGNLQRKYPWSMPPDSTKLDCSHATWDCVNNDCGNGTFGCQNTDILAVGTKLAGTGRWGQMDLSGNVREWTFDWYGTYITPCTDCLQTDTAQSTPTRMMRGGHYQSNNAYIETKTRDSASPSYRGVPNGGIRCVRDVPSDT